MNFRPIYPLSDDPTDLNPLIPGHFLIGGPSVALPQLDLEHISTEQVSAFDKNYPTLLELLLLGISSKLESEVKIMASF